MRGRKWHETFSHYFSHVARTVFNISNAKQVHGKNPVELKCTQTRAIQYQIFKFIRVAKIATALQWQRIEAIYKLNVLKRARREVHERKRERETGAHHLKVYNITSGAFSNHIIFGYRVFM